MKNQDLQIIKSLPPPNQMQKLIKALPVCSHLSTTLNTWKPCKLCRGNRTMVIRSKATKTLTWKYCPECKGEGMMYGQDA
tara:strand:+ start:590 stop:829 length:240 start_codon:yes stop_codon:yes gene_type:complete